MLPLLEGVVVRIREGLVLSDLFLQAVLFVVPLRKLALDVAPAWSTLTAFFASLLQVFLGWVRLGLRDVRVRCRVPTSQTKLAAIDDGHG